MYFIILLLPSRGSRMLNLSSKYNTEQVNFTDWMSFQPSNLTAEISPHPEALRTNS